MDINTIKRYSILIDDVERSGIELIKEIDGKHCWSVYKGRKGIYSHDKDAGGVTMILQEAMGKTLVHMADLNEVAHTVANHELRFASIQKQAKNIGDYLSSPDGAWGR